ncbi:UNC93-like protein [Apiospora phragmitis]|uniref:UNC93-like protein n=1 Tax=Apiospora phragmitis TaxID=2905665 RepID=A0ABR1TVN3_9PEZI
MATFYRSVLAQMIICGVIALLGPGLWNANNSFGARGALLPYLVNDGNSLVFGFMGTLGWSIYSAALYQNNRFGTEWFVMLGAAVCGVSAGLYWAAEGAIVLSYPEHAKRGRYLALWLGFKNSGQLLGGAINLGLNARTATSGKVSWVTLLFFTRRPDGSRIAVEARTTAREQLRRLWRTATTKQIGLLLTVFFSCWYYWGYASRYLTLSFSVRARARLVPVGRHGHHLRRPVQPIPRLAVPQRADAHPGRLRRVLRRVHAAVDLGAGRAARVRAAGNVVQNYLCFLVGTVGDGTSELSRGTGLLRGVESWGQCASFGISSSRFSPFYTAVVNVVVWTLSFVPAFFAVWEVQDRKTAGATTTLPSAGGGNDEEQGRVVKESHHVITDEEKMGVK